MMCFGWGTFFRAGTVDESTELKDLRTFAIEKYKENRLVKYYLMSRELSTVYEL